uniref:Uncharacterized protein n=1 Tax=Anopheles coluzzii TaxID=1518534 RepID=A0A8W7PUL6_ANOCL
MALNGFLEFFQREKTFRPKKRFTQGTIRYSLHKQANASLQSGINLKEVVKLPAGENMNDWLATPPPPAETDRDRKVSCPKDVCIFVDMVPVPFGKDTSGRAGWITVDVLVDFRTTTIHPFLFPSPSGERKGEANPVLVRGFFLLLHPKSQSADKNRNGHARARCRCAPNPLA